jgi:CheY-like chemotaxis protein
MADTVLGVDDEEYIRELLRTFLTETGYQVIVASHGEEAPDLAKKVGAQVIILDVKMPGIDGIETCRRLKSEDCTAGDLAGGPRRRGERFRHQAFPFDRAPHSHTVHSPG